MNHFTRNIDSKCLCAWPLAWPLDDTMYVVYSNAMLKESSSLRNLASFLLSMLDNSFPTNTSRETRRGKLGRAPREPLLMRWKIARMRSRSRSGRRRRGADTDTLGAACPLRRRLLWRHAKKVGAAARAAATTVGPRNPHFRPWLIKSHAKRGETQPPSACNLPHQSLEPKWRHVVSMSTRKHAMLRLGIGVCTSRKTVRRTNIRDTLHSHLRQIDLFGS